MSPITTSDLEKVTREIGKISARVELILHKKDGDPLSRDIAHFARTVANLAPEKVTVSKSSTEELPLKGPGMTIACGERKNIHYLCVPEQNEILPFVHALIFAAQGKAPVSSIINATAQKIVTPVEIIIVVSPFCTNCPLVVETTLRLAAINALISVYVADVRHSTHFAEQYAIQSVPATIIDRHLVHIGEINQERLVEIILNRGTSAYQRDFMRSLIDCGNIDEAVKLFCKEKDVDAMMTLFEEGDLSMRMGVLVVFEEALEKDRVTIQKMVPKLIGMLTNKDPRIRGDMADLLGKIGDPTVLPHLKLLVNDPDPDVVDAAEEAVDMLQKALDISRV